MGAAVTELRIPQPENLRNRCNDYSAVNYLIFHIQLVLYGVTRILCLKCIGCFHELNRFNKKRLHTMQPIFCWQSDLTYWFNYTNNLIAFKCSSFTQICSNSFSLTAVRLTQNKISTLTQNDLLLITGYMLDLSIEDLQ